MQSPTIHHHKAIKCVLKYIKGSPAQGIFIPNESNMCSKAFSDLDWASSNFIWRYTTCYSVFGILWFQGKLRNRALFLILYLKQNIEHWKLL